jgi:hypothetical protein
LFASRFLFDGRPGAPTPKKTLGCSGIIARKKFARSSVEATQSYLAAAFAATAKQRKLPQWLRKTKKAGYFSCPSQKHSRRYLRLARIGFLNSCWRFSLARLRVMLLLLSKIFPG